MAVKVMVAPAIARGETREIAGRKRGPADHPKPRRRRSSVYDCDGNEVYITLMCLKCHKMRPLSQFGLRRMADGAMRNQPWCRTCRSGASAENPKRHGGSSPPEEASVAAVSSQANADPAGQDRRLDAGSVAAQVAAALYAGRS